MTDQSNGPPEEVTITCDGAARGNPGPGGWAALLEAGGRSRLLSGGEPGPTTNNAMEIEAVVQGLRALRRRCRVLLRLDSQYVLGGIEQLQAGARFGPAKKNADRWAALAPLLARHEVRFEWVRGHNGDARNEQVDRAANAAANGFVVIAPPAEPGHGGAVWSLAVLAPGTDRPARWALRAGDTLLSGPVGVGRDTQATAVYRALLAGMRAAVALDGAGAATLDVASNFELLIKQCNGEWRVKNPAQQPLAAEVAQLRAAFGGARFSHRSSADLAAHFEA
jgi:ribonuclease HI